MLNNTSIKHRLIFILSLLCLITVALSLLGLRSLGATNDSLKTVYEDRLIAIGQLHEVLALTQKNHITIAEGVYKDGASLSADAADVKRRMAKVTEVWSAYAATYLTPEEKILAARFEGERARLVQEALLPSLAAMRAIDRDKLRGLVEGPLRQLSMPVHGTGQQLVNLQLAVGKAEYMASQERYSESLRMSASLTVLGIVTGILIGYWIISNILKSLANALRIADSVAKGDLTVQAQAEADNEIGRLVNALSIMQERLVSIVSGVRGGTDAIATAAAEISAGMQDLSSRTEQQASSLEETAASMEELTSTVKENASNAHAANQIAVATANVAGKGGAEVQQVVETMAAIDASSRKISDIISTIDSIAFQTNILALNAAVEAARAGEQGRGFAVVASEVRNLAQRSAVAAKEIKRLIDDSSEYVALGNRRVASAGATMDAIVESVRKVTEIVAQISAATAEQSSGIEQVNVAVTQMDEVTQQNAALVEEASAAAEAMEQQSSQLLESVRVFKVDARPGVTPPASSVAVRQARLALR